jgi:hypothetical protein
MMAFTSVPALGTAAATRDRNLGRVIINPLSVSGGSINVRFAPKATKVLRLAAS